MRIFYTCFAQPREVLGLARRRSGVASSGSPALGSRLGLVLRVLVVVFVGGLVVVVRLVVVLVVVTVILSSHERASVRSRVLEHRLVV